MNKNYIRISNKDGKVWLMPKRHMKTGLELYQPSSRKGMMLKRWLPRVYWLKPMIKMFGIDEIQYTLSPDVQYVIENAFHENAIEYSVFEGTPCVHQKTTIQVFKRQNIIGYCKVTHNKELYDIFKHEQKLLDWMKSKGVGQIPKCLFCRETVDGNFVFLQTTTKTLNSLVKHELGIKQIDFLTMLKMKTSANMLYHDTDQYHTICALLEHIDLLDITQQSTISEAINMIDRYYGGEQHLFSAYHADFTPWNMFEDAGILFVFDFEYGRYSYMPYLDLFHFLTQTAIFERNMSARQIFDEIMQREDFLKSYFEHPKYAYLIYLVDVASRFVVRDKTSRTDDVDKLICIWFILMKMVMDKIKSN